MSSSRASFLSNYAPLGDHIRPPRCFSVTSIYLSSALLPSIYITEEHQVEKFLFPQFHSNCAAQTLISVSGVNPHHPLNGSKTIMRIKLQRRDKAVHPPCMAGSCLSNYRASQTRSEQKKGNFSTNMLLTSSPDVVVL